MIDRTPEFNELDEKLIALLSEGRSKAEAARECGVCRETVSRKWHGSEDFRGAVRQRSMARIEGQERAVAELMGTAVTELKKLLTSADEQIRLKAVVLVLNRGDRTFDRFQNALGLEELTDLKRMLKGGPSSETPREYSRTH